MVRAGGRGAADAGPGVFEWHGPGKVLGRTGCPCSCRHRPNSGWGGGVSEKLQPGLERGWTRHFSSGGEQAPPGLSLCFSGHLHPSHFRAGKSSASAVGQSFGGVCRGEKSRRAGLVVGAGAAGGGTEQTGPRVVGLTRDFSSASLAARTSLLVSAKHSVFRAKRPGGSNSGLVEGRPPGRR